MQENVEARQAEQAKRLWTSAEVDAVAAHFGTDLRAGLSEAEAEARLERFGMNRLQEKKATPKWKVFISQFQDFMIYVLFVAVIIAAFEGQVIEAIAILAILLINGILGFVQEYRAEQALEALKSMSAATASVVRDGVEREIETSLLVPGDLVLLESGDTIPADGRLVEVGALRTIEAALTGESEAVRKEVYICEGESIPLGDMRNMVFSGTSVSVGRGTFIVTATGQETEMGKIATLLHETEEDPTPIQVELERVGKRVAIIVLVIAALVFVEEIFLATRAETGSFIEMFSHPDFRERVTEGLLVAVSLAVAAIPEGLPAIVTMALSMGVRRMAEKNAIVKKLHAVETLGSTTYICSDKTGTLTLNKMSTRRLLVGKREFSVEGSEHKAVDGASERNADFDLLLTCGLSCNDAHYTAAGELVGDPTETAMVAAAHNLLESQDVAKRVAEVPFDSDRKRMTTVHEWNGGLRAFTKGGYDTTIPYCSQALIDGAVVPLDAALRAELDELNSGLAAQGLRTLAFAYRDLPEGFDLEDSVALESELVYIGIQGLQDPARPEVPASVATAHKAGISVVMVTGDHALTARAIADEIGILGDKEVVTGPEIEAMSDEELRERVEHISVYARVNPEHKIRIVSALKERNHVVAMTGDGVNDAPALKRADIGVAMGIVGTDVTREAADMVLADDNFATIVAAIRQGRNVFDNLKKVILFLLSCNMSEVLIISLTSFFTPHTALLPLQILWINLITDGLPALALGVDPAEAGSMERKPRNTSEPILTGKAWARIIWQGLVLSVFPIILGYIIAPQLGVSDEAARTMLFTTLVVSQLLHTLNFRSSDHTVFSKESFKNKWLLFALAGSFILQLILIYTPAAEKLFRVTPLSVNEWIAVLGVSFASVVVLDISKLIFNKIDASRAAKNEVAAV